MNTIRSSLNLSRTNSLVDTLNSYGIPYYIRLSVICRKFIPIKHVIYNIIMYNIRII